jgi:hypothetical protein
MMEDRHEPCRITTCVNIPDGASSEVERVPSDDRSGAAGESIRCRENVRGSATAVHMYLCVPTL